MENKSGDALDEVVWSHIARMVQAAHGLSHRGYMDRVNEFAGQGIPRQRAAWLYVSFILRHAVGEVIQGRIPGDEDLERGRGSRAALPARAGSPRQPGSSRPRAGRR
jgi:hypothetical protein